MLTGSDVRSRAPGRTGSPSDPGSGTGAGACPRRKSVQKAPAAVRSCFCHQVTKSRYGRRRSNSSGEPVRMAA